MQEFETKRLPLERGAIAPDAFDAPILLGLRGGGMAHFELPPGQISTAVTHKTAEGKMNEAIKHIKLGAEFDTPERCSIIELSNTSDDPEASIARARVVPGVTTRWHRVVGTTERYVILEGSGRVEVGSLPSEDVSAGDVVLIPPSCRQRITNIGPGDLIFLAICTPRFQQEAYEDIDSDPLQPEGAADPGAAPDRGGR